MLAEKIKQYLLESVNNQEYTDVARIGKMEQFFLSLFTKERSYPDSPLRILWAITHKCNMRCQHCWSNPEIIHNKETSLGREELERVVDELLLKDIMYYVLTGGEPLLRPDILELVSKIKNSGAILKILTNGSKMETLGKILEYLHPKLDQIQISLDGTKEEHNEQRQNKSFDQSIKSMNLLVDHEQDLTVNFTATPKNLHTLEAVYELVSDIGVSALTVSPVFPIGRGKRMAYELSHNKYLETIMDLVNQESNTKFIPFLPLRALQLIDPIFDENEVFWKNSSTIPIGEGLVEMSINHDGMVTPGQRLQNLNLSSGNILKDGFDKVWHTDKWKDIRLGRDLSKSKCNICKFVGICKGGDLYRTYKVYGTIHASDPYCLLGVEGKNIDNPYIELEGVEQR